MGNHQFDHQLLLPAIFLRISASTTTVFRSYFPTFRSFRSFRLEYFVVYALHLLLPPDPQDSLCNGLVSPSAMGNGTFTHKFCAALPSALRIPAKLLTVLSNNLRIIGH